MNDKLQQAVAAIKAGDRAAGQRLLVDVLKADQNNEAAWLWMSVTMDDAEKKRYCLKTALEINPASEVAKRGLAQLEPAIELPAFESPIPAIASGAVTKTKTCPWCKSEIPVSAVACRNCGKDLPGSPIAKAQAMQDFGSVLTRLGCWLFILAIVLPGLIILILALITK
jgi:ribosomal protein L40E